MTRTLEIVICTYNRAADLDGCLARLACQRDANAEWSVTVVDNNCTDRTAQVVAEHAASGRVPHLAHAFEHVQGLTPARRRGVLESNAEWIAFVDDDCLVARDWVAQAIEATARHPGAGGFGGRVIPCWGREPPPHLARHGWLFAEQDLGETESEVEHLVGAGIIVNRSALAECGWIAHPYLADRTGAGYVSGGDVEICCRLRASGRPLYYSPLMRIDHVVAAKRQRLRSLLGLARGLGAGAELVNLMGSHDPESWPAQAHRTLDEEVQRHWASTRYIATGEYAWRDWLIRAAFLSGRRAQNRALARDSTTRDRLGGVWGGRLALGRPHDETRLH
jgi:glycosyltransferase involved in cell wall biosynthesis